jgi:hypothetical protein
MSEKKRLWLTIGASVAVAGGVTVLVFLDRKEIEETETNIAALDQKIESAEVEIRKTKDREDKVIVFRAVAPRELGILPQKQQIADFHAGLATALSQTGARLTKIPESAPKESELARGVFVTQNTIECEADAASFLRLVNMIENDERLASIRGFKVRAGARPKEGQKTAVHKVTLNLETFFYAPAAGAVKSVPIPGEDARLEDPKVRQEIAAFTPEKQDTYLLRPSASRRDAFVDVRKEVVVEDPAETRRRFEEEEKVVADLDHRLDEVREKVEIEKALVAGGRLFEADRMAQEVELLMNELGVRSANIASVKSVTFPDLVVRVEKARRSIDDIAGTLRDLPRELTVTASTATMTRDLVSNAFRHADFAEVNTICTQWEQFLRGKAVEAGAQPILEEIKTYRHRSKVLAEFHQRSVHVTAVVLNPVTPTQSVALVNGKVTRVGDAVDTGGQIVVHAITREGVTFTFQGENVVLTREDAAAVRRDADKGPSGPVPVGAPAATLSPRPRHAAGP